ncbi:MAG: hypothetical protein BWY17_02853 [Deltaproteobacteria bacterium ADurb.Bin207]|nr:MAG: hypothetical protein BWY17_02853 [Deltaproteobacteria bacterium ADurb.Bin207]HPB96536.1 hypothetical protein [Polyangiaceae bacterium]HQF25845.1 hypothetical protein [Polyangiaceae bacterium]
MLRKARTSFSLGPWSWVLVSSLLGCASGEDADRSFANGENGGKDGSSDSSEQADADTETSFPSDFGMPCQSDEDCSSGLCVEGADGTVCSAFCSDSCPKDYDCLSYEGLQGPHDHVCIPQISRLCRPCKSDTDCQRHGVVQDASRCILQGDFGSFCGVSCSGTCPDSYACDEVKLASGVSVFQCVPEGGRSCECRPSWAALGLETTCTNTNSYGVCTGSRTCDENGLTPCSAPTPSAEVCDGTDNDCDGHVDNGTCSDNLDCTEDVCDGKGQCSNPIQSSSCLIDGECKNSGDLNPTNSCQSCKPSSSQTAWTVLTGSCDDGDVCTVQDTCVEGVCVGQVQQDSHEPNDDLNSCTSFNAVSDCDSYPKGSLEATLYGAGDEDWFTYTVSDNAFCLIYPRVSLTVPTGSNFDLCAYYTCKNGGTLSLKCTHGTLSTGYGMSGCCSNNPGDAAENVRLTPTCSGGGFDDSGTVYVRVFNAEPTFTCAPYTLQYGDD